MKIVYDDVFNYIKDHLDDSHLKDDVMQTFFNNEKLASLKFKSYEHNDSDDFIMSSSPFKPAFANEMLTLKGLTASYKEAVDIGIKSIELSIKKQRTEGMDKIIFDAQFEYALNHNIECECCGATVKYQVDFDNNQIDIDTDWLKERYKSEPGFDVNCGSPEAKEVSVTIPTPSRKIVIANDLRRLFPSAGKRENKDYIKLHSNGRTISINNRLGRQLDTEFWANNGMAFFHTGSGGADVIVGDELIISNRIEDKEDLDGDGYKENSDKEALAIKIFEQQEKSKNAGYISFGLWAVNIMDYDDFVDKVAIHTNSIPGLKSEALINELDIIVVDVPSENLTLTSTFETNDMLFINASLSPEMAIQEGQKDEGFSPG